MDDFPQSIELALTPERRHPEPGEFYCYMDRATGHVEGPFGSESSDSEFGFMGDPKDYAIYRVSRFGAHLV